MQSSLVMSCNSLSQLEDWLFHRVVLSTNASAYLSDAVFPFVVVQLTPLAQSVIDKKMSELSSSQMTGALLLPCPKPWSLWFGVDL